MVKFLAFLGAVAAVISLVKFNVISLSTLAVVTLIALVAFYVWVRATDRGDEFWDFYGTLIRGCSKVIIVIGLLLSFAWTIGSTILMGPQPVYIKNIEELGDTGNKMVTFIRPQGSTIGWGESLDELQHITLVSNTEVLVNGERKLVGEVFPHMESSRVLVIQNEFWLQYDRTLDLEELDERQSFGKPFYIWTTGFNIPIPGWLRNSVCESNDKSEAGCQWARLKLVDADDGGIFNHATMVLALYFSIIAFSFWGFRKVWAFIKKVLNPVFSMVDEKLVSFRK